MDDIIGTVQKHTHPALADYLSSVTFGTTGLFGTVCWIVSSIFESTLLQVAAVGIYSVPAIAYYFYYRPFGIEISYTPTVEKDGKRTVDKVAESRAEAYLRDGECVITFLIEISDYRDDFELEFRTTNEIYAEFRDIPRAEQEFRQDPLTLSGTGIVNRRFQVILEVFLQESATSPTNEYPLKVVDTESGRDISKITLIAQ